MRIKPMDTCICPVQARIAKEGYEPLHQVSIICRLCKLRARMSYSLPLGLRPDEQIPDASAEVKECGGDSRADALEHEETRAWINVRVRLAFEGKAECDK
jgi:hypothetical protein